MTYKLVINRCQDQQLASQAAEVISHYSHIEVAVVLETLREKNVCLKIRGEKENAQVIKDQLEAVGTSSSIVDSEEQTQQEPAKIEKKKSKGKKKREICENHSQLHDVKTDIVIFKDSATGAPVPAQDAIEATESSKAKKSDSNTQEENKDKLITSEFKNEYVKELFRSLRTKIAMGLYNSADKSIVVSSLDASAGKSTMATNIAISHALQNTNVLLIDGDLRRGALHSFFDLSASPGLSDALREETPLTEEYIDSFILETEVPNLSIIAAGEHVDNSSDLLNSVRFKELKAALSTKFDLIIMDTPPLGALTDAVVVSEFFYKYIIIVKAGVTNVIDMKKKINEYPILKKKLLGLVLNYAIIDKMRSYYKYSKYY